MYKCPYCEKDITLLHAFMADAVASNTEAKKTGVAICVECGEAVALQGGAFRKLTADEHVELVALDNYQKNRAIWLENQRRRDEGLGAPAEEMWCMYVKECKLEFVTRKSEAKARAIFFSGVAMAVNYFKDALGRDDDEFLGRMNLLETELEVAAAVNNGPINSPHDVLKQLLDTYRHG